MPLTKQTRWVVIALCIALAVAVGPLTLIIVGNAVGGTLGLLLNRRPTSSELIGTCELAVPWGVSTLDISGDGTFRQKIAERTNASRDLIGRWHASEDLNSLAVEFRPFNMVWDDDHERETNIYEINFYKPRFGTTYGVINDDLGESYKRKQGAHHD